MPAHMMAHKRWTPKVPSTLIGVFSCSVPISHGLNFVLHEYISLHMEKVPNIFQSLKVTENRHSVPIAKQFFTINEKWVLVKFMKALGTFCV